MKTESSDNSELGLMAIERSTTDLASPAEGRSYTISDLAREYNLTLRTLRFYESKGLLRPIRAGSSRTYSEEDRQRLKLIMKGKQLGFTLREISALLTAGQEASEPHALKLSREQCLEQIRLLERQKSDIEQAIGELRRTYSSLYEGPWTDRTKWWS